MGFRSSNLSHALKLIKGITAQFGTNTHIFFIVCYSQLIFKFMYEQIKTKENYDKLLTSGMFWEFHPELTGNWEVDKVVILAS